MTEYVQLYWKRNRGWPWPEDSWGLTPMFGEDGWCRACGVPKQEQTGSIVLQRKGVKAEGAWVPNWQFDAISLAADVAREVEARFDVELKDVEWHGASPGAAKQMVVPSVGEAWFDPAELRKTTIARHGTDGSACPECGVWRWMPLVFGFLPPLRITPPHGDVNVAGSPEWFGDGWKAFRPILVRRELAESIATASPKDFKVQACPDSWRRDRQAPFSSAGSGDAAEFGFGDEGVDGVGDRGPFLKSQRTHVNRCRSPVPVAFEPVGFDVLGVSNAQRDHVASARPRFEGAALG